MNMFGKPEMWAKGNCFDSQVKPLKGGWHPPDAGELASLKIFPYWSDISFKLDI